MTTMTLEARECALCGNLKAPSEYYARLGRLHRECKDCSRDIAKENRRARLEGRSPQRLRPLTGDYKRCPNCQEDKDTSLFHRDAAKPDGLHSHCRSCRSELWEAYSAQRRGAK